MSTWLLIGTHVFTAFVTFVCTRWWVLRTLEKADERQGSTVNETPFDRPSTRLIIVVLVSSLVIILIGGQAYFATGDAKDATASAARTAERADQQIKCTQEWADRLTTALEDRIDLNSDLRTAERARDDSIDGILRVIIKARTLGEPLSPQEQAQVDADLGVALGAYAEAIKNVNAVRETLSDDGVDPTYPVLEDVCGEKQFHETS